MLQQFVNAYMIDLPAVARIRRRVMIVGKFNREADGPELFLFTNAGVSPTYAKNFNGKFSISYENFVQALRPAIGEKVNLDDRFPSVEQVIPSDAGAEPGTSVLDHYNWFFQRAVASSDQPEFRQDAGGEQLLTGADNERGEAILKQIRQNLITFGAFQPRTHELVETAANLLYACAGKHGMPSGYAPGDALPVGFPERFIDFVYDENLSKSFRRFTDGIDFSGGVWKNVNQEVFCDAVDALRSVLVTGGAAAFAMPRFGNEPLSRLAENAAPSDLRKDFAASRNAFNGLRQIIRSKVLLSMILEWIVRSLYQLGPVKAQAVPARRDEAASNAILKDFAQHRMAGPAKRPDQADREEFKGLLAANYEKMLEAVTATQEEWERKKSALPEAISTHAQAVRNDEGTCAALREVAGPAQSEEMRRAFIDATRTIMLDVMCPVLYRSPVLSEQQLKAFFRREAVSAYLTAVLLDDANQDAVRRIAESHLAFFTSKIDERTKKIGEKDAITGRLLEDYLRSIADPKLQRQLIQGMKEIEEVLALLDAAEGDQRMGASSVSAMRQNVDQGGEDQLEATAPASSTIRVTVEARARLALEKVLSGVTNAVPGPAAAAPGAAGGAAAGGKGGAKGGGKGGPAVAAGGIAPAPRAPQAPPAGSAPTPRNIAEIDARLTQLLSAAVADPATPMDANERKKVIDTAVSGVMTDGVFTGRLAEQLKAFEKTLHLIYTRYKKNPDKTSFRNKVDRLTMINLMLLFQKDLGLGKVQSSLYQLLLDVIQNTESDNPSPQQFLAKHSLTEYFDDDFDQRGFTSLVAILRVQAVESLKNTVHFVSELRGVKYLMDKAKSDLDAEIIVVNADAEAFLDWLQSDNLKMNSRGRMRSGGLTTRPGASESVIQPALIYMTDLAFNADVGKSKWLKERLAKFGLSVPPGQEMASLLLPPICVSTSADEGWQAEADDLAVAGNAAPAGVVVVGPSPRLNRADDGFPTVLPAGYLFCAHVLTPASKPLTIPGMIAQSRGRFRAIGVVNKTMDESLDRAIWGKELKTDPAAADGDTYCFAADFYAYLVLTLVATACRTDGAPVTADFYYHFYYSQDAGFPPRRSDYQSSELLNNAVLGGKAHRFALAKDLAAANDEKPFGVLVGKDDGEIRQRPNPPIVTDMGWFGRARQSANLP